MPNEKKRFVYVPQSTRDPDRHYVGLSSNVPARVSEHNAGRSPHTSSRGPWTSLVVIEFTHEQHALRFERYLKSGSGRAFARRHFGRSPTE